MKTAIITLLAALAALPAFAQCTSPCINHTTLGVSNGPTSAIDTTGANFFVAAVNNNGASVTVMSDLQSNTWHCRTRQPGDDLSSSAVQLCYAYDHGGSALVTSPVHTFTATAGSIKVLSVAAFALPTTGSGADPFEVDSGSGAVNSGTPGSITPTAGDLVVTAVAELAGTTCTVSSPYSITDCIHGGTYGGGLAYWVDGAGTATNPTWALSGNHNSATIAAFGPTSVFTPSGIITTSNTAAQIYTAIETANCGDTITIGAGTYTRASGNLPKIHLSGKSCTAPSPITIKAFDSANPPNFDYRGTPLDGVVTPGDCASTYANAIPGSYGGSDTNRGAWQIANSSYIVLDGINILGATDNDCITDSVAGLRLTNVDNVIVKNSKFQQNWDGIFGAGSNVTITKNKFVGNGYFGNDQDHQLYNGGGDNWTISYNTFYGSGTGAGDGCCIKTDGTTTPGGGQNLHTRAWHAYVYGNWFQDGQDYEFDMATPTNCAIAPTGTCTSNPGDTTTHLYFYNNVVVSNAAPQNNTKMSAIIGGDGLNWCPSSGTGFCGGHQQMHVYWNTFYVRNPIGDYTSGTPQPPNDTCCQFSLIQLTNQPGLSTQDLIFSNNVVHFINKTDTSKKALFMIQANYTWSVSGSNNWFDSDIISTCGTLFSGSGGTCLLTATTTGTVPSFTNLAGLNLIPTASGVFGAADTGQTWKSPFEQTSPGVLLSRSVFSDPGALMSQVTNHLFPLPNSLSGGQ